MTAEYVFKAALKSIEQGRKAHCYFAHVPGKGYVNRGETIEETPEYRRQLLQTASSEIENMHGCTG